MNIEQLYKPAVLNANTCVPEKDSETIAKAHEKVYTERGVTC